MNRKVLILALLAAALVAAATRDYVAEFEAFKAKHAKAYTSKKEEIRRFKIFMDNMERAAELQKQNPHAQFGATRFADLTPEEFKSHHNGDKYFAKNAPTHNIPAMFNDAQVAKVQGQAVDWRTKKMVTEVKDQAECGSCWAFSTTGSIESQNAMAGKGLVELSEQELVSCDTIDDGCNGGLMDNAYNWLLKAHNGSIVTEASYPYTSGGGSVAACNMQNKVVGATITGYKDLPHDENQMGTYVFSNGPLAIGVDASSWQLYMGGIMTLCFGVQLDHGVMIVGFDDNNSPPYWIIKNSWGKSWGEQGYIRVQKGKNECLITKYPTTPLIGGGPTPTSGTTSGPTTPPGSKFDQFHCQDPKCQNCQKVELPENTCIKGKTNSFKAKCTATGLVTMNFKTIDCSGDATIVTQPLDVCMSELNPDGTESFFMDHCPGGPTPTTGTTTTSPPGPGPKGSWVDLFTPPFAEVPTIAMAISCVDDGVCYVAGGENDANMFGVYQFDGQQEGSFDRMNIPEKNFIMLMAAGIGGTSTSPHGAVGGVGMLAGGVEYMANTTTFLPSLALEWIIETQDIREINGGANVLVVDSGKNAALYSSSYGVLFSEKKIKLPMPDTCTEARYAAMISESEWFITLGSWPDNDNAGVDVPKEMSARVYLERDSKGHVHRRVRGMLNRKLKGDSDCKKYSAMIAHTTDAGKTWTSEFSDSSTFYFNAIDCNSKKVCVAAAEGFDDDAAARVYRTTDGNQWTQVIKLPSSKTQVYSLMSVDFSTENEIWVAGSVQTALSANAFFLYSNNAGASWQQVKGPDYIGDISDMNFLPDGTGYATAITVFQDSTILKYINGPTPAPTPTPSPTPGTFTQMQCTDENCQEGCKNESFPTYSCLKLTGGGSAIVHCGPRTLIEQIFMFSDSCTGPSQENADPLGQCLQANGGGSFENFCKPNGMVGRMKKEYVLKRRANRF